MKIRYYYADHGMISMYMYLISAYKGLNTVSTIFAKNSKLKSYMVD